MTIMTEHGNGSGASAAPGQLRLLFFVRSIHYDRVLENFLRAVLERGHELHVALALEKRGPRGREDEDLRRAARRYPFSYERLPGAQRSVADPGGRPQARARLPALPRARVRERTSIARARPRARAAAAPRDPQDSAVPRPARTPLRRCDAPGARGCDSGPEGDPRAHQGSESRTSCSYRRSSGSGRSRAITCGQRRSWGCRPSSRSRAGTTSRTRA